MSLITCPDCRNQVSTDAVACPNCGRPLAPVVVEPIAPREVIVQEFTEEKKFPPWAIALIAVLGAGLLFALLFLMRGNSDDGNRNVNVRLANSSLPVNTSTTTTRTTELNAPPSSTTTVTAPPSTTTIQPSMPSSMPVSTPSTTATGAPSENVAVGKSSLNINAKIMDSTGAEKAVQKETFYLLKKDLDSILNDADIDDPEGQGLVNAFGMSVVFPDKYADTKRKALAEINKNIVAKTLTDGQGKAKFPDVKPDSYYLFGITKTKDGFSVWNQPISLSEGATNLNLTPSGSR